MRSNISMSEIAKLFNVSKVTVSKALNDKEGVSEELRKDIKEAAKKYGYRMNQAARSLKTNKSYNIGILIAERYIGVSSTYYFDVFGKLSTKLTNLGYSSIMELLSEENEKNLTLPIMYIEKKIDAIIILGQLKNKYLKQFENFDIPVIFFDFYINESNVDSIVIDNFYSGLAITELLIKKGHEQIGYVGNLFATSSIQDRFLGYYRALLEHKIELNNSYIINDRDETGKLIELNFPSIMPTAFVCNNDQVAYTLVQSLNNKGYKVPEDISVVTFDNTIFSSLSNPKLTTVDTNVEELVNVTSKVIIKKITNPEKKYDRILVKSFIVERDSVQEITKERRKKYE